MGYRVGQKIWHIEINNATDERSHRKNGVVIKELKIIGLSKYKICLNNNWFTTLDLVREGSRKNRSIYSYLDDTSTSIRTRNNILGDGVFVTLYSSKKPTAKLLQKMAASAANKIDADYGFLFSGAKDKIYDMVDAYYTA